MSFMDVNGVEFWTCMDGISFEESYIPKKHNYDIQILTAKTYIEFMCKKLKRPNKDYTSYGYKDMASIWGCDINKFTNSSVFSDYISNGIFIQAALEMKVSIHTVRNSRNCYFNLSIRK